MNLFSSVLTYAPVVIAAASAAANAVNALVPKASTNPTVKTIESVIDFLALNWVAKKK